MTEHVDDLLDGYALQALTPEEETRVRAHIAGCAQCRAGLFETEELIGFLALGAPEQEPRPELKARILATATGEQFAGDGRTGRGTTYLPSPSKTPRVLPIRRAGSWMHGRTAAALVAAAALVLLAGGALIGRVFTPGMSPQQRFQALVGKAATNGAAITILKATSPSVPQNLVVVERGSGTDELIIGPGPAPPSRRVYQLWFIKPKSPPVSAGVFSTSTRTVRVTTLPVRSKPYAIAAVTREPGPKGSKAPTTTPFVETPIAHV